MSVWLYEGISCYVADHPLDGHVPLYRAFNDKDHFYTANKDEYDRLPSKYKREGVACYVATSASGGHKPLYRLYNSKKDDHLYTASESEKANLQGSAWKYEGIACYVQAGPADQHVPFHRAFNSVIVDHFYSTSWDEIVKCMGPVVDHQTGFDPTKHGFRFANEFEVDAKVFGLTLKSWNMGFCGGMCAAALNRFRSKKPVETTTATPAKGSALYDELLHRQIESLIRLDRIPPSPSVIDTIYDWQSAPDVGHWWRKNSVGYRTMGQWPALKQRLDGGQPTQLVLIRVEGYTANMSDNHQVLAIGYGFNESTKELAIRIYDPNDGTRPHQLNMSFGTTNIHGQDSGGQRLRGFFVNPNSDTASA